MTSIEKLKEIVATLRAPGGCPWDQKQTIKTLIPHIIEEAYELVDTIESDSPNEIKDECGDVLLQVVMIAQIASEQNLFKFEDIIDTVSEKMIRRHPHVFGDKSIHTVEQVWDQWETIKKSEKKTTSIMEPIPKLPALLQAHKIQKKANRVGFDWNDSSGPLEKILEEVNEFREAVTKQDKSSIEDEAGDLFFTLVNICRKYDINPEEALRKSNKKFIERFKTMESLHKNETFIDLSLDQKNELWEKAKKCGQKAL